MPDREWFTIETPNRPDARVSVWTPEGAPRAIVQIFHGMAEHIDRYDRVARDLAQKGYVVAGHNHKGHGPETPDAELGYFYAKDGWRKIVEDGHAVSEWLKQQWPGIPLVLLGHSMGSFLARDYITRYPGEPDALILSGTGWYPPGLCRAARMMAGLAKPDKPAPQIDKIGFSGNNKPLYRGSALRVRLHRPGVLRPVHRAAWADTTGGTGACAGGYADLFHFR